MKIIAHRGVTSDSPENTMAAFLEAAKQGYGVECDVRLTADNIPVILHDKDLDRIAGEDKRLSDLSLQQLQQIQIDTKHPIPTLEAVIKHVLPETFVNLNIKDNEAIEPTLKLLLGAEAKHGLLLSAHTIAATSHIQNSLSLAAFVNRYAVICLWGASRSGAKTIVCKDMLINRWVIPSAIKNGYSVYVWGRSPNPNKYRRLNIEGLIKNI